MSRKSVQVILLILADVLLVACWIHFTKTIQRHIDKDKARFESAIRVENEKDFKTKLKNRDSSILAYGKIAPVDPVTHPKLKNQEFMDLYIKYQNYEATPHTDTSGNQTVTWDWETINTDSWHCEKVSFLGEEFLYNDLNGIPDNYYHKDMTSRYYRDVYSGSTEMSGTMFIEFNREQTHVRFYDKTIQQVIDSAGDKNGLYIWHILAAIVVGTMVVVTGIRIFSE